MRIPAGSEDGWRTIRAAIVRPGDIDVLITPGGADALADSYQDVNDMRVERMLAWRIR